MTAVYLALRHRDPPGVLGLFADLIRWRLVTDYPHAGIVVGGTLYHDANLAGTNAAQVNLHVRATGETATNAIARVQIYRNSTCVLDATNAAWGQTAHVDFSDRLPFDFAYYRVKVWQNAATIDATCQWERAWSSPIWIEKR